MMRHCQLPISVRQTAVTMTSSCQLPRSGRLRGLLGLLVGIFLSFTTFATDDLRHVMNFNREWKFQLGDITNAEASSFDDAQWNDANVPHSFSIPYFAADRFYV